MLSVYLPSRKVAAKQSEIGAYPVDQAVRKENPERAPHFAAKLIF